MTSRTAIVIALLSIAIPQVSAARTLRAGVFVGSNEGTFGEDDLFYANEDALKVYMAFSEFGRLDPSLAFLVRDASKTAIRDRLAELDQRIDLMRRHDEYDFECVFYFSGHGGPDGLHVDGEVIAYRDLYDQVHGLGCDLTVLILDACNSGHLLRVKGITFQPEEFRVKAYQSKKGEVFIASSADSEFAQERDGFKGSVFTHFLTNGLLGAADVNQDSQVTLSEAYAYASKRTIQETFGSSKGFQVPSYRYELEGSQDAVLTEFGAGASRLEVPTRLKGLVAFMDVEKGIIWGDFEIGTEGRQVLVPKGSYLVRLRDERGVLHLARCEFNDPAHPKWSRFETIAENQDPIKGRRVFHRWSIRATGGAVWSNDETLLRDWLGGGELAVTVDRLGFAPLYGGVALGFETGDQLERVFETHVTRSSQLFRATALVGLGGALTEYFHLSGELRAGGGWAELSTRFEGRDEVTSGGFFQVGIQGQASWRLTSSFSLLLPAVRVFLLGYELNGSLHTRFGFAASGGGQIVF